MTESERKFRDTYGEPTSSEPVPSAPRQEESPPKPQAASLWKRHLMGGLSLVLLALGLFFGLAVFLAVGVLVLIGSIVANVFGSRPGSSSQHLTRKN